jgi:hypothetical protein
LACKNKGLKPLCATAKRLLVTLLERGCEYGFKHVLRRFNKAADSLANKAMDELADSDDWSPDRARLIAHVLGNEPAGDDELSDPLVDQPDAKSASPLHLVRTLIPELLNMPSEHETVELAKVLYRESRPLRALRPSHMWTDHQTNTWVRACALLGSHITAAIEDGSDLALMQAILDLHAWHTVVLRPFLEKIEQPHRPTFTIPTEPRTANPTHKRAVQHAYQDRCAKAMRELLSNGLADPTHETLELLREAHPPSTGALTKHAPSGTQATASIKKAKVALRKCAGNTDVCMDVFGWAPDLLLPVRADQAGLIKPLARLITLMANAEIPNAAGHLLASGSLYGLNKLPPAEQKERALNGLKHKLRPVNVGSMFLKVGFQLLLKTDQAMEAIQHMDGQKSLCVPRGPEMVAHLARSMWEQGMPAVITDNSNGFNDFRRQAMLDAVHRRAPGLTKAFNLYYARVAQCFILIDDEVCVVESAQGSRMGCVLGSFGFCLTVQDTYDTVRAAHPDIVSKALTDDFYNASLHVDKEEAVQECIDIFKLTKQDSKTRNGLSLNDKCYLLLPPGVPSPDPDDLPDGLLVTRDGRCIAGAPIGTDEFIVNKSNAHLTQMRRAIAALDGINPQVGFKLLRLCVTASLAYLTQVTPTPLIMGVLRGADTEIAECAFRLLTTPTQTAPACSATRMDRARAKLGLPLRLKGFGIIAYERRGPIAYYSSVVAAAQLDDDLSQHIMGLARFADTYQMVLDALGPRSAHTEKSEQYLLRDEPLAMLNTDFYAGIFNLKPTLKLQRILTAPANCLASDVLTRSTEAISNSVSHSDVIISHFSAHANLSLILTAPLSRPHFRVAPQDFRAAMRWYLSIPQLRHLGNHGPVRGLDYAAEFCLHSHSSQWEPVRRALDVHGDHANSNCPAAAAGRHLRHNTLKYACHYAAKEAGVVSYTEPETHTVLLNRFTPEACHTLFPQAPNREYKRRVEEVVKDQDAVIAVEDDTKRAALLVDIGRRIDRLTRHRPDSSKGLRLDGQLKDSHSGKELWYDTTCGHPTARRHRAAEFQHTMRRLAATQPEELETLEPSLTITNLHNDKVQGYALMLAIAKRQVHDGVRTVMPTFAPVALTTSGEACDGTRFLTEWLVNRYSEKLAREGARNDDRKATHLTGDFRFRFKLSLLFAIIKGQAAQLQSAGLPFTKRHQTRSQPGPRASPTPQPATPGPVEERKAEVSAPNSPPDPREPASPHSRGQSPGRPASPPPRRSTPHTRRNRPRRSCTQKRDSAGWMEKFSEDIVFVVDDESGDAQEDRTSLS